MSTRGGRPGGGRARSGQRAAPITVTYASEKAREHLFARIGKPLTDAAVARLGGAYEPGSRVEVRQPSMLIVRGPGNASTATTYVQRAGAQDEELVLFRFGLSAKDGSERIAVDPQALATQVRQARALGFTRISTKARGNRGGPWQDALHLPRLGFDSPLNANFMVEANHYPLPAGAEGATTLAEVLTHPGGTQWLRDSGLLTPSLYFDLAAGSQSMRTLDTYLREHGLPGIPGERKRGRR